MWPECFTHTRGGAGAVIGGRRAASRRCASPPSSPAGRRCWPPAALVGGRRGLGAGVGATRGAPPAPRQARPAPRPARRAGGWPPLPAGRHGAPLPKGPPQPFAEAGGQGAGGGWRTAGAGAGRCCWPAARPCIRPAAGCGQGLTLSSAIESVQPGFQSDSWLNMQNRQEYAKQYAEYVKEYAEFAGNMQNNIQNMTQNMSKICRIVTGPYSAYLTLHHVVYMQNMPKNMQNNMQNMQEICQKICKPVWNMQNSDMLIFCIFVIYICTSHFADETRLGS
jgi:hypothetical protein